MVHLTKMFFKFPPFNAQVYIEVGQERGLVHLKPDSSFSEDEYKPCYPLNLGISHLSFVM